MLKSSVRLLLAIMRVKPRLALAPEFRGRIAANVALFNTSPAILVAMLFVRGVGLVVTS